MSSWIKLIDQSLNKVEKRNSHSKRIHREIVSANIEDDSSQESSELNLSSSTKKRKVKPLENITIENENESSDECFDVEYNPDDVQLPKTEKKKAKTTLQLVTSTAMTSAVTHQPSSSHYTSNTKLHSSKNWLTIPNPNDDINSSFQIEDSQSDSCESSTHTLINESSDDSPQQQETVIETQESITPPVAPFIITTTEERPKKRKVRMKKGGMVEQLKRSLSQAKSNLLFWQHHRSAELIPPGVLVTVDRVENTYGRTLIHTKVNDVKTIFSLCSRLSGIQEGDSLEVEFDNDKCYKTETHVLYSYVDKVLLIKRNLPR